MGAEPGAGWCHVRQSRVAKWCRKKLSFWYFVILNKAVRQLMVWTNNLFFMVSKDTFWIQKHFWEIFRTWVTTWIILLDFNLLYYSTSQLYFVLLYSSLDIIKRGWWWWWWCGDMVWYFPIILPLQVAHLCSTLEYGNITFVAGRSTSTWCITNYKFVESSIFLAERWSLKKPHGKRFSFFHVWCPPVQELACISFKLSPWLLNHNNEN